MLFALMMSVSPLPAQSVISALEEEINTLVQTAKPSVVTVLATKVGAGNKGLFDIFSERKEAERELKVGTGLLISSDGFLLTKESIIREAGYVDVALVNDASHRVEWMQQDSASGLALLKIPATNLQPARFSMKESLRAGSWVTVIGNSLGVPHAVSIGVVSAIQPDGLVQISANVDPGSNGSPIFDAHAHAVGLVMGRVGLELATPNANKFFSNTALILPFEDVLPVVRAALVRYYDEHGWIGVTVVNNPSSQSRPRVLQLSENGPGHKAGLQVGDTITHFDGKEVDSPSTLGKLVNQVRPNDVVAIKVLRGEQELILDVRIAAKTPTALIELNLIERVTKDLPPQNFWRTPAPRNEPQLLLERRLNALEKEIQDLRNAYKRN